MIVHKKTIAVRIILTILTVLVVVFIFSQSMLPANESSAESGRIVKFLNKICVFLGIGEVFTQNFVRVCAHLAEFGVLGVLLFLTVSSYTEKVKLRFTLTPLFYLSTAVADECIQLFSEGRAFQFKDIFIDLTGATLGAVFVYVILLIISRRKQKSNVSVSKEVQG